MKKSGRFGNYLSPISFKRQALFKASMSVMLVFSILSGLVFGMLPVFASDVMQVGSGMTAGEVFVIDIDTKEQPLTLVIPEGLQHISGGGGFNEQGELIVYGELQLIFTAEQGYYELQLRDLDGDPVGSIVSFEVLPALPEYEKKEVLELRDEIEHSLEYTEITVTYIDTLADEILWQGYDFAEISSEADISLPLILTGTDNNDEGIDIPVVKWECSGIFDPLRSDFYSFSPVLPDQYILTPSAILPEISVFIRPFGSISITPLAAGDFTVSGAMTGSYDSLTEAINAVNTNGSGTYQITAYADDTLATLLTLNAGITLTLTSGGSSLQTILQSKNVRHFALSGNLTLTNIILEGRGDLNSGFDTNGGIQINSSGSLTLDEGSVIRKCYAYTFGGGVYNTGGTLNILGGEVSSNTVGGNTPQGAGVYSTNSLVMTGGTIASNSATGPSNESNIANGAGIYCQGNFTMSGGNILNNTSLYGNGGGIYCIGNVTLTGGTISGNRAHKGSYNSGPAVCGGGVYSNGALKISAGVTIANNSMGTGTTGGFVGGGGGVYGNSTIEITGGTFSNNRATGGSARGGAVYASGAVTITGGSFTGNSAVYGGAIMHLSSLTIEGDRIIFDNNSATSGGGGIHNSGGMLTITGEGEDGVKITNNKATSGGAGGIRTATGTISGNVLISGNTATYSSAAATNGDAAGIYVATGITINAGVVISNNSATDKAGGIYLGTGKSYLTGVIITGNTARNGFGGGIYSTGELTVSGGVISNNQALSGTGNFARDPFGGGIYSTGTLIITDNAVVSGNTASGNAAGTRLGKGAGVYSTKSVTLQSGEIKGNTSTNDGGGVHIQSGSFLMEGGSITGNISSTNGGGVYIEAGTFLMEGGSITGNTSSTDGGGIYNKASTDIVSGIISKNTSNRNGGGIYTTVFRSLFVRADAVFSENSAASFCERHPDNDAVYLSNILLGEGTGKWTAPFIQGYNNYDINQTPAVYTVTYNGNSHTSGTAPLDTNGNYPTGTNKYVRNSEVTVLDNIGSTLLAKNDHIFIGWSTDPNATTVEYMPSDTFNITADTVLYAVWEANTYNITYSYTGTVPSNAPTVPASETDVPLGTAKQVADAPTLPGYIFSGWTSTDVTPAADGSYLMPNKSVEFTGSWTTKSVVVTYKNNFDSTDTSDFTKESGTYGATLIITGTTPVNDGYTFGGWYKEQVCTNPWYFSNRNNGVEAITGTALELTVANGVQNATTSPILTLYAKWIPNEYTVSYDANYPDVVSAETGSMTDQTATYNENLTLTSNAFTKVGYTFIGWKTTADGTDVDYVDGYTFSPWQFVSDLTLYAQWEINTHDITYSYTGTVPSGARIPSLDNESSVEFGTAKVVASVPTMTGYTFSGWTTSDATVSSGVFNMPDNDVSFTGSFVANSYTVTYNANGGSGTMTSDSVVYNQNYSVKANSFSRSGYTFKNWNIAANGSGTSYSPSAVINITGSVTLYAQWTKYDDPPPVVTYTVTYLPGTRGTFAPQTTSGLTYGVPTPAAPAITGQSGYIFNGWSPSRSDIVTGNATYVAQWIEAGDLPEDREFTVRFVDWNGILFKSELVAYGSSATAPIDPKRDGYEFTGWDRSFDYVTSDITVTAQYRVIPGEPDPKEAEHKEPEQKDPDPKEPKPIDDMSPIAVDEDIPSLTIGSLTIPLIAGTAMREYVWALLNLILAIAGVMLLIVSIIRALAKKTQDDEQNDEYESDENQEQRKPRPIWIILSILLGVIGIIVFFITEDMTKMMVLLDRWTVVNAVVLLLEIICFILSYKKKRANNQEDYISDTY